MASSGRDAMSVSPRTVRGHAAAAAAGKPHGATFGNAAPKSKGASKRSVPPLFGHAGKAPSKRGVSGAKMGGAK